MTHLHKGILEPSRFDWNVCVNMEAIVYKPVVYCTYTLLTILPQLIGLAHLKSFTWEIYVLASRDLDSFR